MTSRLPIKPLALAPETESKMSSHAMQVSVCGVVRIKRGVCLMYQLRSEPTGEERSATVKAALWVVSQTQGSAGM
jgi:hypothetical protein